MRLLSPKNIAIEAKEKQERETLLTILELDCNRLILALHKKPARSR
jgi:hypothetical protein